MDYSFSLRIKSENVKQLEIGKRRKFVLEEFPHEYGIHGYYPTHFGEVLSGRYVVLRKMGWGTFSTVWLCWDMKDKIFAAVKIGKANPSLPDEDNIELDAYEIIRNSGVNCHTVVKYLDNFTITGPHGTHVCIVLEMMGQNLSKLILGSQSNGINLQKIKYIIRQVLIGLDFLHTKCKLIHADIKPDNVLMVVSQTKIRKMASEALEMHFSLIEFPASFVTSAPKRFKKVSTNSGLLEWLKLQIQYEDVSEDRNSLRNQIASLKNLILTNKNKVMEIEKNKQTTVLTPNAHSFQEPKKIEFSCQTPSPLEPEFNVKIGDLGNATEETEFYNGLIQTRQYRSIEVVIKSGYTFSADIWSTACMAFELATGNYLFNPLCTSEGLLADKQHICQILSYLGPIPKHVIDSAHSPLLYINQRFFKRFPEEVSPTLSNLLTDQYKWSEKEAKDFVGFLLPMLNLDKHLRATASECLHHPWLNC